MRTTTVTCDQCGKNLAHTTNCIGYRICVENERIPSIGSVVTAMQIDPPLKETMHFCGTRCLGNYAAAKMWAPMTGGYDPVVSRITP